MRKSPLIRPAGVFLALTLALSACGQDEEATGPGTGGGRGNMAADARLAEACEANLAVEKGFNKLFGEMGPEGEGPVTPEQVGPPTPEQVMKIQEAVDKDVLPHVQRVEANAPREIEDQVKVAAAAVRKFRADPVNYSFEEDEEANAAIQVMEPHFFENCDYKKGTVEAVDYEFKSVPSNLKSGEDMAVRFDNQGSELHEFVVLGKKEGVTDSWDDILKLEPAQGQEKTLFVGVAFSAPGKQDYAVFSIPKPGDYIAVCFIPRGTTSEEQLGGPEGGEGPPAGASPAPASGTGANSSPSPGATAGEGAGPGGPPHFTLGMRKELKVA